MLPNREVFQNRAADEFAHDGIFGNKFWLKRQEPFQESQQAFRVSFSPRKRQGNRILLPKQLYTWEWYAYLGAGLYNVTGQRMTETMVMATKSGMLIHILTIHNRVGGSREFQLWLGDR